MRKCIKISHEFLEDLLGLSRAGTRIDGVFAKPGLIEVHFEDDSEPTYQSEEPYVVQWLRTYR